MGIPEGRRRPRPRRAGRPPGSSDGTNRTGGASPRRAAPAPPARRPPTSSRGSSPPSWWPAPTRASRTCSGTPSSRSTPRESSTAWSRGRRTTRWAASPTTSGWWSRWRSTSSAPGTSMSSPARGGRSRHQVGL